MYLNVISKEVNTAYVRYVDRKNILIQQRQSGLRSSIKKSVNHYTVTFDSMVI